MISRFYIQAHFSRKTKSSLRKIRKIYFFRSNNIYSHGFFSLFIITFCIGFARTEKKYTRATDDDNCKGKVEVKAKFEIMNMNRIYKKADKKIWTVLRCKEIVALCDFLYKV